MSECSENEFDVFSESEAVDIPACNETVTNLRTAIDNGNNPITSERYYYLSEIEDLIGGSRNLPCFLKAAEEMGQFNNSTLIIDKVCVLTEPLVIPSRFSLVGTGLNGEGELRFSGLGSGISAIQMENNGQNITIADLAIGRIDGGQNIGIDMSRGSKIYVRNTQVTDFFAGIYGSRPNTSAISIYIDHCNIFRNNWNLVIDHNAFHWRIHDCILNQATCWGLYIFDSGGNDHVISGCRFESCNIGGASIGSYSAMLLNNRFELNGIDNGNIGIRITPSARQTRLVSNLFSSNIISDLSPLGETQEWGSIPPRNIIRSDFVMLRIRSKLGSNESSLPESSFPFVGNSVEKEFHINGNPEEGYIIIQLYNVNAKHRILINGRNLPEHDILVDTKGWTIWTDEIPNGVLIQGTNSIRIEAVGNDNFAIRHIILQWRGVQI